MSSTEAEWVRHGECDGCGACCEWLTVPLKVDLSSNPPDWLEARGFPLDGIKYLPLIDPCPQLTTERRCAIYENRPTMCRDFPTVPQELERLPCTYWFENAATGEKLGGTRSPHPFPKDVTIGAPPASGGAGQ